MPDFSTSDIFVAGNGTLWAVCTENNEDDRVNRVWVANKPAGGNWTRKIVADNGVNFPVQPGIVARSDSEIFAFWREPGRPIRYVRSTNAGETWSGLGAVDDIEAAETFAVPALGP
ncbi:exo-alpha-sialidase [Candidatus Gracilibacteria bacterium]|nr:exo-alpha-sialidase [Candidatus Gracilibacteria bacterium]